MTTEFNPAIARDEIVQLALSALFTGWTEADLAHAFGRDKPLLDLLIDDHPANPGGLAPAALARLWRTARSLHELPAYPIYHAPNRPAWRSRARDRDIEEAVFRSQLRHLRTRRAADSRQRVNLRVRFSPPWVKEQFRLLLTVAHATGCEAMLLHKSGIADIYGPHRDAAQVAAVFDAVNTQRKRRVEAAAAAAHHLRGAEATRLRRETCREVTTEVASLLAAVAIEAQTVGVTGYSEENPARTGAPKKSKR